MPRQNRVTPFGEFVAVSTRGTLTGNRGCLHDDEGRLGTARWRSKAWIACLLAFRGRQRAPMPPGAWTALFFLDEATAFAAGHRPCAQCRHGDFRRYVDAWRTGHGLAADAPMRAAEIDAALHAARIEPFTRRQRRDRAPLEALPEGTMIVHPQRAETPALWWGGALRSWSFEGYGAPETIDAGMVVDVITPAPTRAAFSGGYRPQVQLAAGG